MNKFCKCMLIIVLAMMMVACGDKTGKAPASVSDDVVAIVNGSELTIGKLEKTFIIIEKDYMEYWGEDIMTQDIEGKTVREIVRTEILNNLINDELIRQHMSDLGFKVDDLEVEEQYTLFTTEELEKNPEQEAFYVENGIAEEFIKESIKSQMYVQEYYKRINDDILLEEDSLEDLYGTYVIQVRARHILVEDEALGNELLVKIEAGEEFAKLAEENSKDPGSAANGGDLDFFRRGQMVPEFNDMAFSLKPNEVSGLVKTDYGYHIIKVEDTKTIQDMIDEGVEEVAVEQEKNMLIDGMIQEKANTMLLELKTVAEVQKFEDRIN